MTAIVCTYLLLTSTYCLALSEVWTIVSSTILPSMYGNICNICISIELAK